MTPDTDRERLIRLEEVAVRIEKRLGHVETQVDNMNAQANRWRGGLFVILGLGGVAGAALVNQFFAYVKSLFQ